MKRRLAAGAARVMRVARGLWPDRNPLRRTLDRVEGAIVAGLAVAFLAGTPLAAAAAGHLTDSIGSRAARAQQAARHHVPAVLLATAPTSGYPGTCRRCGPAGPPRAGSGAPAWLLRCPASARGARCWCGLMRPAG